MNNIYLVGFMATGKTAAGKELARRNKLCFIDLDELIELKAGRTVRDIFAQKGEPYFRKLEKEVLKEVARENNFVVACGGGIVIDKENIAIMKNTGSVICLTAGPRVILKRTAGFTHRPLLDVKDPARQIELLLKLRAPYYARADKTLDTSGLTVKGVAEKILRVLKPQPSGRKKGSRSKKRR
ncbi:MAG: shikimate kinase [Candidatus Omnitrophota bacterium]